MSLTTMAVKISKDGLKEVKQVTEIQVKMNDHSDRFKMLLQHLAEQVEYGIITEKEFKISVNKNIDKFLCNVRKIKKLRGTRRWQCWS